MVAKRMRSARHWQLLFLLTGLVMMMTVAVAIYSLSRVNQTYNAMERALQFLMSIRTTHSAIQAVEISAREYLLWNNEQALQDYRDSVAVVANEMQQIHSMGSDIHLLEQVDRFQSLLSQRLKVDSLDELEFPYAGVPTPKESWNLLDNTKLLQEIRAVVKEIEESHAKLLIARQIQITRNERIISIALAVVSALGMLGMILMYRVLRRSLAQQARWESELLQQKQELEDRVVARTIALQQNSLELERSNRELEDFAFVASHDLQEPLRKIQAFGDRLRERNEDMLGESVDYLDRMQSAAARMSTLIQDLLEFSRVTTKPRIFNTVSLEKVLTGVLDDLEESINRSGATVVADPLPEIEADSMQMHQLLQNLIGNAIKFVASGESPQIRITARLIHLSMLHSHSDDEDHLELHVIDQGIGFDMDFAERIFKPFQRLHARTEYTGTGIGLALCRRIVERHQGSLTASSTNGHGSDFTIILPLKHFASTDDTLLELNPEIQQHADQQ